MVRKISIGIILILILSKCFAGYSSGGRSGYSSVRSSSYSMGRTGYSRSSFPIRTYTRPSSYSRSYSGSSNNTIIHNNNYSHGGYGFGGGGFFSGFLGSYLGISMANMHNPVVVAGAPIVSSEGQGMMMDNGGYVSRPYATYGTGSILLPILLIFILIIVIILVVSFFFKENCHRHDRW